MTNNDFSFPISAKDNILNILPEGTIVFGGVLRDILDNKCVTNHFNDIDVLLPEEEDIGDLVQKITKSINEQGCSISEIEINKKTNNRYHKDYDHYSLSFIFTNNDQTNYVVSIDAIKAKNPTSEFISDFSVNSLYGVVTKKNNQKSIDIIGSICNQFTVDDIKNHINTKTTNQIFKSDVAIKQRDWRTNKILNKGYSTNFHQGMYDFATAKSIVLDCAYYIAYIAETLGKTKSTETSNNSNNKVNTNMSNISFSDRFKANAIEGAYQGAAATAIQELANALIVALKASGMDEVSVSMAEALLKSDMGKAALSVLIGTSLPYIPLEVLQNEHMQKIADKCVQSGTAAGFNTLATLAIGYVKPSLEAGLNVFANASVVPGIKVEQPKVRVEAPKAFDDMSEDEILAELEARRGKKSKVA